MGYGSLVFILPCFNEAQNIGRLLAHLKQIAPELPFTSQITVVSDECSDETDSLVRKAAGQSRLPISLIQNPRRVGKVHGINQALKGAASCEWAVLISGDALPDSDCVAQLLSALVQPGVGIAAARPIPVGPPGNWVVRLTQLLFCLHHEIALRHPKSTEITAFRNEVGILPEDSLVDEAEIEWVLHEKGFRTIYVPEARIFTNAPTTFFDYVKWRRRVVLGYHWLEKRTGKQQATTSLWEKLRAICRLKEPPLRLLAIACCVEAWIVFSAKLLFYFGKHPTGIWECIRSTKRKFSLPQ